MMYFYDTANIMCLKPFDACFLEINDAVIPKRMHPDDIGQESAYTGKL
jgi:hypothetical protein